MATLDEQIAQGLRDNGRSGELQSAQCWGKPLARMNRERADTGA
jgi:hypothetical protein